MSRATKRQIEARRRAKNAGRRRVAVAVGCAIAGVGVGVGIGYHLGRRQRLTLVTVPADPIADPAADPVVNPLDKQDDKPTDVGLRVEDGRIVVESYDRLFAFLPEAFEDARRSGIRGAEQILAIAIRRALPRYRWPPPADSALSPQWRQMVKDVALLFEPEPEPVDEGQHHLRIV